MFLTNPWVSVFFWILDGGIRKKHKGDEGDSLWELRKWTSTWSLCTNDPGVLPREHYEDSYSIAPKARARGKYINWMNSTIDKITWIELVLMFCFPFWQTRKDATQVIANLQRQQVNSRLIASDYLESNKDLLDILVDGYGYTYHHCLSEGNYRGSF